MERQYRRGAAYVGGGEDDPQSSSENGGPDSPLSGDDPGVTATATTAAPSPKKSRRSIQKRVVSVPIADVEGSSSSRSGRGEAYPPSDSWAWRKYGQKPIKGSPYPRGYYRCSSSKGCPARKQVERSRVDPTMLVITYASEHNHPQPTSSKHHHLHHHHSSSATAAAINRTTTTTDRDSSPSPTASPTTTTPSPPRTRTKTTITITNNNKRKQDTAAKDVLIKSEDSNNTTTPQDDHRQVRHDHEELEKPSLFPGPNDLGLCGDHSLMDFSWLSEVAFEGPSYVGPRCVIDDAHDVGISSYVDVKMREEDEKLFADLDELPECSAVFKSRSRGVERCSQLGTPAGSANTAAPVCGGTG